MKTNLISCFEFDADELKADRDIVLAAVGLDGNALRFASDELKADRNIVLAAVGQTGNALEFAAHEYSRAFFNTDHDNDVSLADY